MAQASGENSASEAWLGMLRCPRSGQRLHEEGTQLVSEDGRHRYDVSASGVVLFEQQPQSTDAAVQQKHYDRVAANYIANLDYPHTQEYNRYLDGEINDLIAEAPVGRVAELCCGSGEGFRLLAGNLERGVGVDISSSMLEGARAQFPGPKYLFVQGDVTNLPLQPEAFDTVLINGGIHHINDREALFREVLRILKPGGRFIFREPCDDFGLWRGIRKIIYRLSPALDADTERPIRHGDTMLPLGRLGFVEPRWETHGFLGFCIFMNSDVLVFNRLFRFVPFIRSITRAAVWVDKVTRKLPGLSGSGLQVVGSATKPGG